MDDNSGKVTVLLKAVMQGDKTAEQELIPLIYEHLHHQARRLMFQERSDHTLQPTALVGELYLKLFRDSSTDWQNRAHFFAIAAQNMRRILVDHARARNAQRRPSARNRVCLDDVFLYSEVRSAEVLALDEALERLAESDLRLAQIVEMRFFGGLSNKEIALVLNVSERTIKRDWEFARSWVSHFLEDAGPGKPAVSASYRNR